MIRRLFLSAFLTLTFAQAPELLAAGCCDCCEQCDCCDDCEGCDNCDCCDHT